LKDAPVKLREARQEEADLEVILGHETDLGDQVLGDVFGAGLLVDLGGEVETALGGVLVEGALEEEVEGLGDLAFELVAAEEEGVGEFAHRSAYIYAHFSA
jgi:hypothetical protein